MDPVPITALRVCLVRSHTLEDFCRWIFTEGDIQEKLLANLSNHSMKTFKKGLERRDDWYRKRTSLRKFCRVWLITLEEEYLKGHAYRWLLYSPPATKETAVQAVSAPEGCAPKPLPFSLLSASRGPRCSALIYQLEADGFHLRISSLNLSSESLSHILNYSVDVSTWRLKSGLYKPNSSPPGKTACPF